MARLTANGIGMNVQQMRSTVDGPLATVVFIHGILTDSLASWYFTLAKPFADAGVEVIMYDLRGHGRSERPSAGYTVDDFVDDLSALLDELDISTPVYLVGNSFGGTVAFSYADRNPERVAGIAMIESEPATEPWAAKMTANLARAARQLVRREALLWITARYGLHTTRLAKSAAKLLQATSLEHDIPASRTLSTERLRSISCPVLAIYGTESDLAEQAPVMRSLLARCSTVVIPGQEHSVLIEVPDIAREQILSWLREQERARVGAT